MGDWMAIASIIKGLSHPLMSGILQGKWNLLTWKYRRNSSPRSVALC